MSTYFSGLLCHQFTSFHLCILMPMTYILPSRLKTVEFLYFSLQYYQKACLFMFTCETLTHSSWFTLNIAFSKISREQQSHYSLSFNDVQCSNVTKPMRVVCSVNTPTLDSEKFFLFLSSTLFLVYSVKYIVNACRQTESVDQKQIFLITDLLIK